MRFGRKRAKAVEVREPSVVPREPSIDPARYVPDPRLPAFGPTQIKHLDGIAWHDAYIPSRHHQCWAQTQGWVNFFTSINRCACGNTQYDGAWMNQKNTRPAVNS